MKILYVISTLGGGGAESQLCYYAAELRQSHPDVFFEVCAIKKGGEFEEKLVQKGIKVTVLNEKNIAIAAMKVRRLLKKGDFDIVHSHMFFSDIVSRIAAIGLKVKTVVTHHGLGKWKKRILILLDKATKGLVDKFIVVSEASYNLRAGREKYPVKKMTIIYNGISKNFLCEAPKEIPINGDKIVVGTIARMTNNKQIDVMIDVIRDLGNYPYLNYEVVGDGENYDKLVAQVKALKLEDRVTFMGWRKDVLSVIKKWHIFALPSLNEDLPVSIIECMAQGIVPVASTVGGIPFLLDNGKNGILCDSQNRKTFADAIEYLINNPKEYAVFSERSRKLVENMFMIEKNVNRTLEIYSELLS